MTRWQIPSGFAMMVCSDRFGKRLVGLSTRDRCPEGLNVGPSESRLTIHRHAFGFLIRTMSFQSKRKADLWVRFF